MTKPSPSYLISIPQNLENIMEEYGQKPKNAINGTVHILKIPKTNRISIFLLMGGDPKYLTLSYEPDMDQTKTKYQSKCDGNV